MIKVFQAKIVMLNGDVKYKDVSGVSAHRAFQDIHNMLESTNHITLTEGDESLHVVMRSAIGEIIIEPKK